MDENDDRIMAILASGEAMTADQVAEGLLTMYGLAWTERRTRRTLDSLVRYKCAHVAGQVDMGKRGRRPRAYVIGDVSE